MYKKDKMKSLKFKLKIALIIILPLIVIAVIAMIPRWISPNYETEENANIIIRNTFYTVTPRIEITNVEIYIDDLIKDQDVTADLIWGFGIELFIETLEEYELDIEMETMLYFVNAGETPMKSSVDGFVMYYTNINYYTTDEILGINAAHVDFQAAENLGINVIRI